LTFDWIIIETTGLADPGAVAQTFFAAPELRESFMLDGIVVVVDALHAQRQLDEYPVVQRQVGFADRLLLSKCDVVDAQAVAELSARLNRMNPRAAQQELVQGRAHPNSLLGIGGFNLDASLLAVDANSPPAARFVPRPAAASGTARWSRRAAAHGDDISALLLEAGEVDIDRIGTFVQSMIDKFGDELLRYKGILAIPDEARKLIFQGVQRVAGFDYGEAWAPSEPRLSRIVLIGKSLPEARLRAAFLSAVDRAGENRDPTTDI
jgi:G3E family GTPase